MHRYVGRGNPPTGLTQPLDVQVGPALVNIGDRQRQGPSGPTLQSGGGGTDGHLPWWVGRGLPQQCGAGDLEYGRGTSRVREWSRFMIQACGPRVRLALPASGVDSRIRRGGGGGRPGAAWAARPGHIFICFICFIPIMPI
jgi:hypothetical protein